MVLHYRVVQYHSSDRPQIFVYMVTKQAFGGVQRKLLFQSSTESGWIRKDLSFQSNVEFQVSRVLCFMSMMSLLFIALNALFAKL